MSISETESINKSSAVRCFVALMLAFALAIPASVLSGIGKAVAFENSETPIPTPGWTVKDTCEWQIKDGVMTVRPINGSTGKIYGSPWIREAPSPQTIKRIVFEGAIECWDELSFYNMTNLERIEGMTNLDTSNVSYMNSLFSHCSSLKEIDLSSLDTSNVTFLAHMFSGCSSLKKIDLSGLDTSKVEGMQCMFDSCTSLETVKVSNLDTSSVTNMACMFARCPNLKEVDVSNFDTSKVESMLGMFVDCSSLTSLDVSGFDTSNATDISGMFAGCSSLQNLDVTNFDTSNVTDMSVLFLWCSKLESLDLSSFNTSNVANMREMFAGCSGLKSLDLSGFDTAKVTNMSNMFDGCTSLESIDLSSFDTSAVTGYNDWEKVETNWGRFFRGCNRLSHIKVGPNFALKGIFPTGNWRNEKGRVFTAATVPTAVAGTYEKISLTPLSSAKISKTSVAFTGKAQKPTVKVTADSKTLKAGSDYTVSYSNNTKVGTAKITIKGIGAYSGTKTLTFKINPPTPAISKAKTAKKSFTATWGVTSALKKSATGYQVRFSTSKSMKNAKIITVKGASKKSTKVSKLKSGTKYYMQVRSYTKIGKTTYYSEWSKTTTAKVK